MLLDHVIDKSIIIAAISTTITTEILGFGSTLFLNIINKRDTHKDSSAKEIILKNDPGIKWILIILIVILLIRIMMGLITSTQVPNGFNTSELLWQILSNSFSLIITIGLTLLYVRFRRRSRCIKFSILRLCIFIILVSSLSAIIIAISEDMSINVFKSPIHFCQLFIASLLIETAVYCIVFMLDSLFATRRAIAKEKAKASQARFNYIKLKQQVNPHFLFNSLNILDCMVKDNETEQASLYIHKMAAIYRYLIKNENENTVLFRDEIQFVEEYISMLKVRFENGFDVIMDIRQEDLNSKIPPCVLQLLIENAIKHNSVSKTDPLLITIKTDGSNAIISNRIIPKFSQATSTGIGQKYIREQYRSLTDKKVSFLQTDKEYIATIPLL